MFSSRNRGRKQHRSSSRKQTPKSRSSRFPQLDLQKTPRRYQTNLYAFIVQNSNSQKILPSKRQTQSVRKSILKVHADKTSATPLQPNNQSITLVPDSSEKTPPRRVNNKVITHKTPPKSPGPKKARSKRTNLTKTSKLPLNNDRHTRKKGPRRELFHTIEKPRTKATNTHNTTPQSSPTIESQEGRLIGEPSMSSANNSLTSSPYLAAQTRLTSTDSQEESSLSLPASTPTQITPTQPMEEPAQASQQRGDSSSRERVEDSNTQIYYQAFHNSNTEGSVFQRSKYRLALLLDEQKRKIFAGETPIVNKQIIVDFKKLMPDLETGIKSDGSLFLKNIVLSNKNFLPRDSILPHIIADQQGSNNKIAYFIINANNKGLCLREDTSKERIERAIKANQRTNISSVIVFDLTTSSLTQKEAKAQLGIYLQNNYQNIRTNLHFQFITKNKENHYSLSDSISAFTLLHQIKHNSSVLDGYCQRVANENREEHNNRLFKQSQKQSTVRTKPQRKPTSSTRSRKRAKQNNGQKRAKQNNGQKSKITHFFSKSQEPVQRQRQPQPQPAQLSSNKSSNAPTLS